MENKAKEGEDFKWVGDGKNEDSDGTIVSLEEAVPAYGSPDQYTIKELREMAKARGLAIRGKKTDLLERIAQYDVKEIEPEEEEGEEEDDNENSGKEEIWRDMLSDYCEKQRQAPGGVVCVLAQGQVVISLKDLQATMASGVIAGAFSVILFYFLVQYFSA